MVWTCTHGRAIPVVFCIFCLHVVEAMFVIPSVLSFFGLVPETITLFLSRTRRWVFLVVGGGGGCAHVDDAVGEIKGWLLMIC